MIIHVTKYFSHSQISLIEDKVCETGEKTEKMMCY